MSSTRAQWEWMRRRAAFTNEISLGVREKHVLERKDELPW